MACCCGCCCGCCCRRLLFCLRLPRLPLSSCLAQDGSLRVRLCNIPIVGLELEQAVDRISTRHTDSSLISDPVVYQAQSTRAKRERSGGALYSPRLQILRVRTERLSAAATACSHSAVAIVRGVACCVRMSVVHGSTTLPPPAANVALPSVSLMLVPSLHCQMIAFDRSFY